MATPNLQLVPPCAADAKAVTAAYQDLQVQRWVPIPVPCTLDDGSLYAGTQCDAEWPSGNATIWAMQVQR